VCSSFDDVYLRVVKGLLHLLSGHELIVLWLTFHKGCYDPHVIARTPLDMGRLLIDQPHAPFYQPVCKQHVSGTLQQQALASSTSPPTACWRVVQHMTTMLYISACKP
jgi:hypothetical protein